MPIPPFEARWPIVGMIHVRPLPGSPRFGGSIDAVLEAAGRDAAALVEGGVDGLIVENFGDAPFWPARVPATTVAALAVVVRRIVETVPIPVGVNVLRNDGRSALAIAAACGARFVRVNVLAGVAIAGEGTLRGMAHRLLRDRRALGADVAIWADLRVKHAAPLTPRALEVEAHELVGRGGADAVVLSGAATGSPPERAFLEEARAAIPSSPRVLGSGLTAQNAASLVPLLDGAIVGSSLKAGGVASNPVDEARVRALVSAVRAIV